MRIADLPKYIETAHFSAWRNTWAYRKLGYPYIGFYIKKGEDIIELWARPSTDLEPFLDALEALKVEYAEGLAYTVIKNGPGGLFKGTYIMKAGEMLITLDPVEGGILNFVFYLDGKELMLSIPRDVSLIWLISLLRALAKKKKGREARD